MGDLSVVLRTNGERTRELCRRLVEEELGWGHLEVIEEKPFFQAVRRTFAIGAKSGTPYLLGLDADVLLFRGALTHMVQIAQKLMQDHVLRIDFPLIDLFRGRTIGVHFYNNAYSRAFGEFLDREPAAAQKMRVESDNIRDFAAGRGLSWADLSPGPPVAWHDYHQYLGDICRKYETRYARCLVDGNLVPIMENLERRLQAQPGDLDAAFAWHTLRSCSRGEPVITADLRARYGVAERPPLGEEEMAAIREQLPAMGSQGAPACSVQGQPETILGTGLCG